VTDEYRSCLQLNKFHYSSVTKFSNCSPSWHEKGDIPA
jgi:hypothetical protein